jgi:hypothetical protein
MTDTPETTTRGKQRRSLFSSINAFVILGVFLMGLGLLSLGLAVRSALVGLRAEQWPATIATVTEASRGALPENFGKWAGYLNIHDPISRIKYSYEVQGTRYTGSQVQYGTLLDDKTAINRYTPGTQVSVHCDPANPRNCVLQTGAMRRETVYLLLVALLSVLLAVFVLGFDRRLKDMDRRMEHRQ